MSRRLPCLMLVALLAACGGSSSSSGGTTTIPTLTFSHTGVSPPTMTVASGSVLRVTNQDATGTHQLAGDSAGPCASVVSGDLAPGASWDAHLPVGPKDCAFHDTHASGDVNFQATVSVSAPGVYVPPGGIY